MSSLTMLLPLTVFVTQAGEASGGSGWTWLCVVVAALAVAAAAWFGQRLTAAQRRLKTLSVEHSSTAEAHRALLDKERKEAKDLDARREELRELKRELQAQKKKNHEQQEELKKLRDDLRLTKEESARSRSSRPAFEEPAKPAEKPRPEPVVAVAPPPQPEAERPSAAPPPAPNDDRVAALERRLDERRRELESEQEEHRQARAELRQLRKRVESLRRIDLVSTSKLELLEDRLAQLGREHYDVISQLALLKGEVQPVPPPQRKARPPRAEPSAADAISDGEAAAAREELATMVDETAEPQPPPRAAAATDSTLEHSS